jgi:hypothetical protein
MKLTTISNNNSFTTTKSIINYIINYRYIFIFLISIISLILYYVILFNILIFYNVIDVTFDNITEINIFDDVYCKFTEIPNSNIV